MSENHRKKRKQVPKSVHAEQVVVTGEFMGTKQGFGFVRYDEDEEDIFIPERYTLGAMNGDTVRVRLRHMRSGGRHKSEGEVEKVLVRNVKSLVGSFQKNGKTTFVLPDDKKLPDIYIPKGHTRGAKDGQKVFVDIMTYSDGEKSPEGAVTRVLGYLNEPGVDVESVIAGMELPVKFKADTRKNAAMLPSSVSRADRRGRKDYRDLTTVTIDGDDTKDFDDAITLSRIRGGYELGVHIADVSHYVKEGSPLDREAYERGTSIYLADRVIPMLPEKLSNGICSLNEGEDRLTLSCVMKINDRGEIISHEINEGVIRVNERMTYHNVAKLLELAHEACDMEESSSGGEKTKKKRKIEADISLHTVKKAAKASGEEATSLFNKYKKLIPWFMLMEELSDKMKKLREKHGSIEFNLPECQIKLDKYGKPIDIRLYDRNKATLIIEEFMLAANRTVAEEAYWLDLPFVYRCHDEPEREKIKELFGITARFGHTMKLSGGDIHPKTISTLMKDIQGTEEEDYLTRLTLRAMMRAEYRMTCDGHFGLAEKYYCHFTSPIRRYPDLQIHRILKENIHGGMSSERLSHYDGILAKVSKHSSDMERRADDAEREVDNIKKVAYMQEHLGDEYEGVISGVTGWGIYVELKNTIEGMARINDLTDDRYDYDEENYRVVGHRTRKEYRLGQKVRVQVAKVDLQMREIDFLMLEE